MNRMRSDGLFDFSGKVALVVGSSVGIGAATARLFADLGAEVVLASRDLRAVERVAAQIVATGRSAASIAADVTVDGDIEAAVELAIDRFGGLDLAVNNAGVQGPARPLAKQTADDYHRIIDVNLNGVWRAMRAELPAILERGGGAIVNTASVGGIVAAPGIGPYCASKHGVIGLTRALAMELAPKKITVNAICPGWVETDMARSGMEGIARRLGVSVEQFHGDAMSRVPLGRMLQPDEIAPLALYLLSDASAMMTGQAINLCGGATTA